MNPHAVNVQRGVLWGAPPSNHSVVVVGDLHGLAGALKDIIDQTCFTGCTLVFVGDYIDRGCDGDQVLHSIHGLTTNPSAHGYGQVVALRGNHEDMILRARNSSQWLACWQTSGGRTEDWRWLCEHQGWDWLASLPLLYQHPKDILFRGKPHRLVVSHASVNRQYNLEDQKEQDLLWRREVSGYRRDTLCVHGHTPQSGGVPFLRNTPTGPVLLIDTGSVKTGIVTGASFDEVCS
ncbi:metallophosphoesterase [Candidatus Synechococcus spongiarum]|uniref:Serine/threonine protein phosphatase n=1 Tax=Candidatus Synechococcus spongiarum TaxID=431041 RepID=A0A170TAX4_9SYNE|nr:metallophosphoesterase [Candidatus Synechococcus spongiarum]CZB18683.1 serine/threonine protein phosphatase [Candidatus Synechococcus spongiarum]